MTTEDFVTDYLDFLGVRATDGTTGSPSLAGLNRLFVAHLDRVPYETFDINARRVAPSLCGTAAVNRVLGLADPSARPLTHPLAHPCTSDPTHSHAPMLARGGYCFELVRPFAQLLRRLGYDSRPLMTHPHLDRRVHSLLVFVRFASLLRLSLSSSTSTTRWMPNARNTEMKLGAVKMNKK